LTSYGRSWAIIRNPHQAASRLKCPPSRKSGFLIRFFEEESYRGTLKSVRDEARRGRSLLRHVDRANN
jgi:hypothetical protein